MNTFKIILIQFKYGLKPFAYLPVTFIRRVIFGRDPYLRQYFWDKWGFLDKRLKQVLKSAKRILWIDGASGGEILQLVTFTRKLKERNRGLVIIFSTASDDAYRYAEKMQAIDFVFNTPWDFGFIAKRVIRQINPRVFMSVEFSRVPLHFKVAQSAGIPTVLISGLMSCNLQQHPTLVRAFHLKYYKYFDYICAKEEKDRVGFIKLGVDTDKIEVMGNMKFDLENLNTSKEDTEHLRQVFQIGPEDKVFVAASVLPPEERVAIDAYVEAKQKIPNLRFVIAPRFNKCINNIIRHLKLHDLDFIYRSQLPASTSLNGEVVIVDTFGELSRVYHLADYIFLSGSIWPVNKIGGGKNIVEPLFSNKPVFFGPHMNYWKEITSELKSVFKNCEVKNAQELASAMIRLENKPTMRDSLCRKQRELLHKRSDIIEKNVNFTEALLAREIK